MNWYSFEITINGASELDYTICSKLFKFIVNVIEWFVQLFNAIWGILSGISSQMQLIFLGDDNDVLEQHV